MSVKFYDTEWQKIKFNSFYKTDPNNLAGVDFYSAFYKACFEKYSGFHELDSEWCSQKKFIAQKIELMKKRGKVLAVGCGLGYIEHELFNSDNNKLDLEIHEISDTPLKWISEVFPKEKIHVGYPDSCFPAGQSYDAIYMSAIDYTVEDPVLINTISVLREKLTKSGELLLISGSFLDSNILMKFKLFCHQQIKKLLHYLKLYDIGQLWGYMRSKSEYRKIHSIWFR